MKVLIFDRSIKSLGLISGKFINPDDEVVVAENASQFLNYLLDTEHKKFDALIICRKELARYGINEEYFLGQGSSIFVCSYSSCDDSQIYDLKISHSYEKDASEVALKESLEKALSSNDKENLLNKEFIYSLPKKSGLLLNHLIMNQEIGLSDKEIAKLFWGDNYRLKMNCIYNHVYNLRKALKAKFDDLYIIHKEANRYKLIGLKKGA